MNVPAKLPTQNEIIQGDLTLEKEKMLAEVLNKATHANVPSTPLTPMQLMQRALEAGNLELVERMMALQERAEAGAARKAFGAAMSAAQGEMRPISQDAANPQTRSRYASFAQLDRALRPIYSKHGFSLSYDTEDGAPENCVRVVCLLEAHGHERKHHIDLPADGKGAKGGDVMTKTHATMSAITYGRRQLLKMIFNVAEGADLDDDGNAAGRVNGHPVSGSLEDTGELISHDDIAKLLKALEVRNLSPEWMLEKLRPLYAKHNFPINKIEDIRIRSVNWCFEAVRTAGDPQ